MITSKQFQPLVTWPDQPSPPAFHNLRTFPFFGAIYRKPFSLLRNQNQSFPIMSCEMTPLPCVKITFVWYFFLPFCLYVHLCSYTFIYVHICSYMFIYVCIGSYMFIYVHICKYINILNLLHFQRKKVKKEKYSTL